MQKLLEKYIRNEANAKEKAELERQFKSYGYLLEDDDIRDFIKNKTTHLYPGADSSDRMRNIVEGYVKRPAMIHKLAWLSGAAAVLVLALSVTFIILQRGSKLPPKDWVTQYNKGPGVMKLTMPDSTEIWLNSATTIQYAENYYQQKREIKLSGEAFFKVKRDTTRPFQVFSKHLKVRVLGTAFNINAYDNDPITTVGVASGKVAVNTSKSTADTAILIAGDRMSYNRITHQLNSSHINPESASSWKDGYFEFSEETLDNIAQVMERRYGLHFEFKQKELKQRRITLKQKNESLKNVMEVIRITANIKYTIADGKVTISE